MENISETLMKKLKELSDLEIVKTQIKSAIFLKQMKEKIDTSTEEIKLRVCEEIRYYGQNPDNYSEYKDRVINKYRDEFEKMVNQFQLQLVNVIEEMQEAQANQKIAIANYIMILNKKQEFGKSNKYNEYKRLKEKYKEDMDNSLTKVEFERNLNLLTNLRNPLDLYDSKLNATIQKTKQYDDVISICEEKMSETINNSLEKISNIVSGKTYGLKIYEKSNFISRIINKITNIFNGRKKLQSYIINNENLELQKLEQEVDLINNSIKDESISFIENVLSLKQELNEKFEKSFSVEM